MVWKPAIVEEVNRKLLQLLVQNSLERFKVAIFVKNRVSLISTR